LAARCANVSLLSVAVFRRRASALLFLKNYEKRTSSFPKKYKNQNPVFIKADSNKECTNDSISA
jgi:hypothetical protein